MISKEKKAAIMKEYARTEGDTTWTVSLPEENRHRKIPCTD